MGEISTGLLTHSSKLMTAFMRTRARPILHNSVTFVDYIFNTFYRLQGHFINKQTINFLIGQMKDTTTRCYENPGFDSLVRIMSTDVFIWERSRTPIEDFRSSISENGFLVPNISNLTWCIGDLR